MNIKGYKVNFLGDSITEGTGVTDIENCRYDNRLKKMCELSQVNNYGIGGTRLAHQTRPSERPVFDLCFGGRAYCLDRSADMNIVYGGVNDYIHGDAPFGTVGDTTVETFCGGVYYLMSYIKELFPGKPFIFMTPAHCLFAGADDRAPSTSANKLPDAKPLIEYVKVIEETGRMLCVPVLNLYETLGLDPRDDEIRKTYTTDGLHFNDLGHAVIAERLKEFIEAL